MHQVGNQCHHLWHGQNQSVIDTTIVENHALSAVTNIDDIEFWDWARRTQLHSLWYCDEISTSPMLKIVVEKALRRSCHYNVVAMEFFVGITTSKIQFMGLVSQHTKQGYLSSFLPVSFVLFRTDVYSSSTVVVCTLTTRNHIQLNMQGRLLQLVQIFQYQAHKIKFLMIILNVLVGVDITLNYSSRFGYNAMGFDTSTLTQDRDNMDGYFGIMTQRPIPVLKYGDSLTWAKYCYKVLHPDMIRKLKPGQDTSYRNTLRSYLQTDVKGLVSFHPFDSFHNDIDIYINNQVHGEMTATQQFSYFDEIFSPANKESNEIFSFLEGKAIEATIVPSWCFSIFFIRDSINIDF
jgi:hypothetical protein